MARVNSIQNYVYYMTLCNRVKCYKRDAAFIREKFGKVGLDIYEGRTSTILSEAEQTRPKNLIERIKPWWNGNDKYDYEPKDRLSDLILKYGHNKQGGTVKEVEDLFGKEGVAELKLLSNIGMIII